MSKFLPGLIWIAFTAFPAAAQQTNDARQIAEVKAAIAKIGTGKKVHVTRRGKPSVKGAIRDIREDDFEVISTEDGSFGVAIDISYSEVVKIKGKGVDWGAGGIKAGVFGLKALRVMGIVLKGTCLGPISRCSP